MEISWIYILCAILGAYVNYTTEQYFPHIPCPNVFQYQHDGREWHGVVLVKERLGQKTEIEMLMTLTVELPTEHAGSLELYGSRDAAYQQIRSNQPVAYRVRFPLQSQLPKLTQISVNEEILCSASPDLGSYTYTTRYSDDQQTTTYDRAAFPGGQALVIPTTERSLYDVVYPGSQGSFPGGQAPVVPTTERSLYGVVYPGSQGSFSGGQGPVVPTTERSLYGVVYPGSQGSFSGGQALVVPTTERALYGVVYPGSHGRIFGRPSNIENCGRQHGRHQIGKLIVGGENVNRGTWPWLVAVNLKIPEGLLFICGGNLVSNRAVVSAAHCFRDNGQHFLASDIVLFLGRHNRNNVEDGSKMVDVEKLIVHNDFKSRDELSSDADVAVLIMKESVVFTNNIRPICLWEGSSADEIVGKNGTVIGWGYDETGVPTPEPRMIELPIVSEVKCLRLHAAYRILTSERTFCAGRLDGNGPCNGDSGSGMTIVRNERFVLIGIVSASVNQEGSTKCNLLNYYVVFTDIRKFNEWIKVNIR